MHLCGLSTMDKLKMYGKASTIGMLSGLGSGMIQSTTQSMGVGGMATDVSGNMIQQGDGRIDRLVQNTSIDGIARTATNSMIGIENTNIEGAQTVHVDRSTVMNPGGSLNSMTGNSEAFDSGRKLTEDPAARQEFVRMYGQKMGLEKISPEAQNRLEQQITRQINAHPIAAGKMFSEMKGGNQ